MSKRNHRKRTNVTEIAPPQAVEIESGKELRDAEELVAREILDKRLSPEEIAHFNAEFGAENAFVIVQRLEPKEEIQGGVIKARAKRDQRAMVILAGPGEWNGGAFCPVTQKPGQEVLVTKYGGTDVELEGREFLIVHTKQIYATVKKIAPYPGPGK
jgi:chaperonin GroES